VVLVGHDHEVAVAERLGGLVHLAVLQAENLFDVRNLRVARHRRRARVPHVEQFAAQGEDAVPVPAGDGEAADDQGFGRVAFREDEGAVLRMLPPRIVGVHELGQARDAGALGAVAGFEGALRL
jgi:hypothetical protein